MRAPLLVIPLLTIVACRGSTVATAPTEPATAAPATPSATSSTPPLAPAAPEPASSCLMVNVCSCNLGCASVPLAPAQVRVGARTHVTKGALAGSEVKVVEMVDATGARVLALTDLDHDHACSLDVARAGLGYGCEATKAGPIPAKACAKGCD